MSIETLLSRIDGVKQTQSDKWVALCPGHDDRTPSLSIRQLDDGRILVNCFAGCHTDEVLAAIGLTFADLYPDRETPRHQPGHAKVSQQDCARVLAHEAGILVFAAEDLANGQPLSRDDHARLMQAVRRIRGASDALL